MHLSWFWFWTTLGSRWWQRYKSWTLYLFWTMMGLLSWYWTIRHWGSEADKYVDNYVGHGFNTDRHIYIKCLAGVLVLVINYTGDRIHFGLATERARREGIKVQQSLSFCLSHICLCVSLCICKEQLLMLILDPTPPPSPWCALLSLIGHISQHTTTHKNFQICFSGSSLIVFL